MTRGSSNLRSFGVTLKALKVPKVYGVLMPMTEIESVMNSSGFFLCISSSCLVKRNAFTTAMRMFSSSIMLGGGIFTSVFLAFEALGAATLRVKGAGVPRCLM